MDNKFQILNATIEFSDEFINYNKLRARFLDMSNDALDEFTLSYGENFKTLEDVYTKGIELGEECLDKYVGKAISVLIEYDVLNIDKNLFLKKYIKEGFSWQEDFQEILAKDKENNNGDKKKKKEENTEDNFIKRELGKSIKKNVFNIHYAVVEALKNSGITSIGEAVSQEDKEEAEALFNNLSLGLIPQEKETKVIESIIYKNPYDDRVYLYILKKYGDETKGVEDITRFLKVSVIDEKEKLIKAYYENLDKSTEESTLESIEKFKAYANKMHYNETLVYFNEFDKILAEHDLKLRTVDGEVFNTREEANIAKEELKKVLEIEEEIKEDTEEDLTIAIDKIQEMEFETDIYIKHLEILKSKRSQIITAEEENNLN